MKLSLIWAMSQNRVIGRNNALPWHLPGDLRFFKRTTMGKCMIMGRKTFESIGKPLPGRISIVVTRDDSYQVEGVRVVNSLTAAVSLAEKISYIDGMEEACVIGGAKIFSSALPLADRLYVTLVHAEVEGDVCFPEFDLAPWRETWREDFGSDEVNPYDYSIFILEKAGVD
ncbi:MAG: dihydrofolate reductase [Pseudohongiellaceae bacterium]